MNRTRFDFVNRGRGIRTGLRGGGLGQLGGGSDNHRSEELEDLDNLEGAATTTGQLRRTGTTWRGQGQPQVSEEDWDNLEGTETTTV